MSNVYEPPRTGWEHIDPAEAGFDQAALAEVTAFAEANESPWPRSMYLPDGRYAGTADMDEKPPFDEVLGSVSPRGPPAGLVIRHGRVACAWGDPARPEMTFSVAKSYLAILTGIALGDGLIGSLDEPVAVRVRPDEFAAAQNRAITWRHLLWQTSEWEGALWGKPDLADRNRHVGPGVARAPKGTHRDLQPPGSHWEYNDVRVNLLAFCLLQLFRRPLPEVLRERIMDPIGASADWRWKGYRTSTVQIDGRPMVSVSGGAHWGGGMFIPTTDHARFGLLVQRGGVWGDRRLLPEAFLRELRTPCPLNPVYGFLWWLNTGRAQYPSAPETSLFAIGLGTNLIWLDPEHDLVVVARWIARDKADGLIARVLGTLC